MIIKVSEVVRDPARLNALQRTRLLDSSAEEAFDRLTRLASKILHVPVALVSLVDEKRQFFKSQVGLPEPWASKHETPLTHSFCQYAVASGEPLIVTDANQHPLVRDNLAISELGVIAYAGIPLTGPDGQTLGAFCAIDNQPREWTAEEIEILTDLAAFVMTEVELRLAVKEVEHQVEGIELERRDKVALLNSTNEGIYGLDRDGRCTFINKSAAKMLGYTPEEVWGQSMHALIHHTRLDGSPYPLEECPTFLAYQTGQANREENEVLWRRDGTYFAAEYSTSPIVEDDEIKGAVVTFVDITARKQAERQLLVQHAVSHVLADTTDFEEAGPRLLHGIGEALDWQVGAIWRVDPDAKVLRCTATWKVPTISSSEFETTTHQLTFPRGVGLVGQVWASGTPIWSRDVLHEDSFLRAPMAAQIGLHGAVLFPIRSGRKILGVIEFYSSRLQPPDVELIHTIFNLGNHIGQFIEREQAEEELRQSEALKRAVLETAIDCIISIDHHGEVIEWNPAAEKTFGYSRAEVIGQEMAQFIVPPFLQEAHRQGLAHYLATGEGPVIDKRIEVTGMHADGTEFPVELAITRNPLAGPPTFTGFVRDITERKRAEEALRHSEERFRSLVEVIPQQVWTAQPDGALDYVSQRVLEYFGRTFEEMIGWGWQDVIHPDDLTQVIEQWGESLTTGKAYEVEFRLKRAHDQTYHWHIGRALPLHDRSGRIVKWFGTNTDITDQKQIEEELNAAKEAAEVANQAKSQFLANMSHELRTPLNTIIIYSELLQEEAEEAGADQFIPDLEKIRTAGKHLLSLVNNVLDLSKIEAGKTELYLEIIDVADMIKAVTTTVQPLVDQKNNSLHAPCAPDLGSMYTDVTKVRQNLFNLLSNAAKFTEDGTILLEANRQTDEGQDWITFRVTDSGVGMTPEQIDKLFRPFSQADASTNRKFGGTGLGLAITKHFCEMMGGEITVDSEPGKGTTFVMRLPAEITLPADQNTPDTPSMTTSVSRGTGIVLVIDDDPAVHELMTRLLSQEGFQVKTARDGDEGLRLAKELHPDVITLDVMMPRLDGWAVLVALKADPELVDIPVIMLTILDNKSLGYTLGASEYLTKPIDRERLNTILKKYGTDRPAHPILIIEDDSVTRQMLRGMLKKQGWQVMEAVNGQVALERVAEKRPALILLDLMMPEMDGFEFAEALKQNETWRSIPIIVMTAKDLTREERLRLNAYVKKILQKGMYTHEELLREVRDRVATYARMDEQVKGD